MNSLTWVLIGAGIVVVVFFIVCTAVGIRSIRSGSDAGTPEGVARRKAERAARYEVERGELEQRLARAKTEHDVEREQRPTLAEAFRQGLREGRTRGSR